MPNPTDHLKKAERSALTLALPYGRHAGRGHLIMSVNAGGADPTHQIKLRQALCEGTIDSLEGVWYLGTRIDAANYTLNAGTQTAAPASPFDLDFAHFTTAMIDVTLPVGTADENVTDDPPENLEVIGKFLKVKDYDASGTPSAATYSVSPARVLADIIHERTREPLSKTNWTNWDAYRNYVDTPETVDYTTLPDFDGIGLKGSYYSDTTFTTLVNSRTDPSIYFDTSSGHPALGQTDDNFSVRWEGKIKAKTTGTYTFTIDHNDSIQLWIDDLVTPIINQPTAGSHSTTIALTADQLYNIKIEWIELTGDAQCRLLWTPPSETSHAVPHEYLYPKAESKPRYEAHALFAFPTDADAGVRKVLAMANSVMQTADGKRNFYCIDNLSPVMAINESHIKDGTFKFYRRDVRDIRNHWEATFRDLESQYLETATPPVTIEFPDLQEVTERVVPGQAVDLGSTIHWQAYKVLRSLAKREVEMELFCEFDGLATTYMVLPGDLVTISYGVPGWFEKQFLVLETTDYSAEETPDRRGFVCMEWT